MNLIAFTEVETTSPAEETVTTTAPAEESATVTLSPEATAAAEETVVKETEAVLDFSSSAPILTIGAIDGETTLLMAESTTETTATTETAAAIGFEPMNFVTNLQYMGTGMLTIFIVIGAIILATTAINKIFSKKKD